MLALEEMTESSRMRLVVLCTLSPAERPRYKAAYLGVTVKLGRCGLMEGSLDTGLAAYVSGIPDGCTEPWSD